MTPTADYLHEAFDCTRIVLVETFLGMSKLAVDNKDIINNLFAIGYEYMQKGKWIVSKYIFNALNKMKGQKDADIWCNTVNFYVSCKNLGKYMIFIRILLQELIPRNVRILVV